MNAITTTQVRAAIARENSKLSRQQEAVEATKAMIAILEQQLAELEKPAPSGKPR